MTSQQRLWLVMKIRKQVEIQINGVPHHNEPIEGLFGFCPIYETYEQALEDAGLAELVLEIREKP